MTLFARLVFASALLWGGLTVAESRISPQDFAVGFPLQLQEGYGAYTLDLNEEVYRTVVSPQLADLRIFDDGGTVQPHVLDLPRPAQNLGEVELPLFTLYCNRPGSSLPEEVRVETGPNGTVIQVTGQQTDQQREVWGYLLDLGGLEGQPKQLYFNWAPPEEGFVSRIVIEGSNDLASWRPLQTAVLADLNTEGQRILRDSVELPADLPRYLRFAWPREGSGVELQKVVALVAKEGVVAPLRWLQLEPQETAESSWTYDAGGPFPVRRLQIELPQAGNLARVRLESRAGAGDGWRPRYQGLLYNLQIDGKALRNEEVTIVSSDRYWRLVVEEAWGQIAAAPTLRLGWQPHRLRFSASGKPPYLLAAGSISVSGVDADLESGFRSLIDALPESAFGKASLGPPVTLAGEAALVKPVPKQPLPWRSWILWGVLILGVLVVAGMVRSLLGEMKAGS